VASAIEKRKIDLMVNVPAMKEMNRDAYTIRRLAIDNHVPLLTNAETGRMLLSCLANAKLQDLEPKAWSEYHTP
jgi:carbamoyl-phosphate synthase large subunit